MSRGTRRIPSADKTALTAVYQPPLSLLPAALHKLQSKDAVLKTLACAVTLTPCIYTATAVRQARKVGKQWLTAKLVSEQPAVSARGSLQYTVCATAACETWPVFKVNNQVSEAANDPSAHKSRQPDGPERGG